MIKRLSTLIKKWRLFIVLVSLLFLNSLTIERPEIDQKYSLLYSNPLFLRVSSPTANKILADKMWLLSKNIDEIRRGDAVDEVEMFKVYKNIAILDSTLEVAVIYASTYLASIKEREDLAVKLLQTAQLLDEDNFQYLFSELIFQIAYLNSRDSEYLKLLAKRCYEVEDSYKIIGRIDVTKWVDDIILYLQESDTQREIQKENREWLKSMERL